MRSRANTRDVMNAASLHWFTHFVHVHKRAPKQATKGRDYLALHEIVRVQCFGETDRALSMVEDIIRAPITGDSLARRYVTYWAWIEKGRPTWLHADGVGSSLAASIRQRIARNVARRAA